MKLDFLFFGRGFLVHFSFSEEGVFGAEDILVALGSILAGFVELFRDLGDKVPLGIVEEVVLGFV